MEVLLDTSETIPSEDTPEMWGGRSTVQAAVQPIHDERAAT